MLHLYSWPTPNGHKLHIMLAELEVSYQLHPINIMKGEQLTPEYLKINPNNKIPALIDEDGPEHKTITIFESGAILFYLAEKYQRFFGNNSHERYQIMQWL
nr:glutathione S-transferase N-terminal domain-containing protein [Alphaproteobacteria bacterium]